MIAEHRSRSAPLQCVEQQSGVRPGLGNGADVETDEPQIWHRVAQHFLMCENLHKLSRDRRLKTLEATFTGIDQGHPVVSSEDESCLKVASIYRLVRPEITEDIRKV